MTVKVVAFWGASAGGGEGGGSPGTPGTNGWSPVLAAETDGDRRVLRVIDWTGGSGTKPLTGRYVGAAGLVVAAADALDVRGPAGQPGAPGADGADGLSVELRTTATHIQWRQAGEEWADLVLLDDLKGEPGEPGTPGGGGGGGGGREVLTAPRTYYVAVAGDAANSGLTAGDPLPLQHALDVVGGLDFGIHNVTIQLADGTYTGPFAVKGWVGAGELIIRGNNATPSNTILTSTTDGNTLRAEMLLGTLRLQHFRLQSSGSGKSALFVGSMTRVVIDTGMVFGATVNHHINTTSGAVVDIVGNYTIAGSAMYHIYANDTAQVYMRALTCTLSGTPHFSSAFCGADANASVRVFSVTFTGAATGNRYLVRMSASLWVYWAGTTYLPGSGGGSVGDGGVYA